MEYQTIETPDGPVEFPAEMADAEIQQVLAQQYPPETPIADAMERGEGAVDDFMARGDATGDQFQKRVAEGVWGPSGFGVSDTAQVAAAGIEYAAGRGLDALAAFTPQEVQDAAGEFIMKGVTAGAEVVNDFLQKNPKAMEGVEALKSGYGAVTKWLNENPGMANDFSAVFDIVTAATPAKKVSPVIDSTLGEAGRKIKLKGVTQSIDESREATRNLIYPDEKYGAGDTDEAGLLNSRTYTGTAKEDEIAEALLITDKIKPDKSYAYNQARAYEAVDTQRVEMETVIKKAGNPKVDRELLIKEITESLGELGTAPGTEMLVGNTKEMAENLLTTAIRIFDETDGRALSMVKARREFDKVVRQARGDQFDPEKASAASVVNRIVRNSMNDSVQKAVGPKAGDDVYHYLRQQHLLLEGADNLYDSMKKEQLNLVTRAWANVTRLGHLPRTPLALVSTGAAAGTLASTGIGGIALGAVGVGLVGRGLYKGATSATAKKGLGELLIAINKGIKTSENSAMIKTLKADRLLVIEMLKESTPEEERPPLRTAGNG